MTGVLLASSIEFHLIIAEESIDLLGHFYGFPTDAVGARLRSYFKRELRMVHLLATVMR